MAGPRVSVRPWGWSQRLPALDVRAYAGGRVRSLVIAATLSRDEAGVSDAGRFFFSRSPGEKANFCRLGDF